jgi:dGTPase
MRTREEYLERERRLLAPCAVKAAETRGRRHPEPEHPLRSPFERDRDRVIHSRAFRKLEYKTQVFVNHEGDYYRTRLTHTLEAAQITRSLARFLHLNEDLAEAVALVHDVGHPPFGHAGEQALEALMQDRGGFEHNRQGLRIVDCLESRYPEFPGLNLTWEVREGIAKHSRRFDPDDPAPEFAEFAGSPRPSLEAQLADACDQVAYNAHDVDDGLTAGLITLAELEQVPLWKRLFQGETRPGLTPEQAKYLGVRALINAQAHDIARTVEARVAEWGLDSPEAVRNAPGCAAALSPEMEELNAGLRQFLQENVYRNFRVYRMSIKARRVLEALFRSYEEFPAQLPAGVRRGDDLHRALCDYLAGLTDREALDEHRRLFDPFTTT